MTTATSDATFARIRNALASSSREATIFDVKRAVMDEFRRVDRRVDFTVTEYFRHTYVPDLVLRWGDSVDRSERAVFLRSTVTPEYLADDIETTARDQPIIFALSPAPSGKAATIVQERSTAAGTLVTDASGLDELAPPDQRAPIPEMVSRVLLRGGRGILDETNTASTTQAINAGFEGALRTDPTTTFAAAASIRENVGQNTGARLLRLLHAIWVGSGGRSDQFPNAPALTGPLSDDALEMLLTGVDITDPLFWQRLGEISLTQLGRLTVADRPRNLGRLLLANVDRLDGRWCRVRPDEPRTGMTDELQWGIESGAVALHGSNFTAYFSQDKAGIAGVDAVEAGGITFAELSDRATRAVADISDVTAVGDGLIVEVASESQSDIMVNPKTSNTVGGASGNITRATATLRNRHIVLGDFKSTTATSRTVGTLTLRELVRHGLPLVWELTPDDLAALEAMVEPVSTFVDPLQDQMSLFEQLELTSEADSDESTEDDEPHDS